VDHLAMIKISQVSKIGNVAIEIEIEIDIFSSKGGM
jgi:hypothetical protein